MGPFTDDEYEKKYGDPIVLLTDLKDLPRIISLQDSSGSVIKNGKYLRTP